MGPPAPYLVADRAWQQMEVRVSEGRAGDPERGRQRLRQYVLEEWFPNHQIELSTRQSYHYILSHYILPEQQRFLVKPYPKDFEWRRVTLTSYMLEKLKAYVAGKSAEDLLFVAPQPEGHRSGLPLVLPDPETLGKTEPNVRGRSYQHGTLSAYTAGGCRCQHCRDVFAYYRAQRRLGGLDDPQQIRMRETDGHIPAYWFRSAVWNPAVETAGIGFPVRVHDLRRAHASWLLAGGADLQVVKERLGHASVATTERYLHTLPNADEKAVAALDKIRKRTA